MNDSNKLNENNTAKQETKETGVFSGTIVSIDNGDAFIKINGKESEAIIPLDKFNKTPSVGNIVSFKVENKNGSIVITEIISNNEPITEGVVILIENEEVIVNVGYETNVKLPVSRFTDIEVGDKVKMRLSGTGDKLTVVEVLSRIKGASPAECEHPTDDDEDDNTVKAKFRGYNYTNDIVDVEVIDTKEVLSFQLGRLLPNVEFGKEITEKTNFYLNIVEEGGLHSVKEVQYDNSSVKAESKEIVAEVIKVDVDKTDNSETQITLKLEDTEEEVVIPLKIVDSESVEVGTLLKLDIEEIGDNRSIKSAKVYSDMNDEIDLRYIDKEFMIDVMSVPTHSELEYRMVAYIIMWARRNNILYQFDEFGNVYLTKGELDDGEYYPCVTSHLDTVQSKHDPYIFAGVPLELKVSKVVNQGVTEHKLSVNDEGGSEIGIGADDKGGICICLSMFEHIDKLKACFFLDEERGCNGSDCLDKDWFKDVGYVIGFDSPDLYRAAWACDGTQLFNYDFYTKYMKKVCDSWGLSKGCFFSEPYTDVKNIREKTELICMNFGNGGYNAHNIGGTEYCIMEHMDQACGMGVELIEEIGNTKHTLKHTGRYTTTGNVSEIQSLEELGDNTRKGYKSTYSTQTQTNNNNNSAQVNKPDTSKDDEIKFETVKYVVEKYDSLIDCIKEDVLSTVKSICEDNNIDFSIFEDSISDKFSTEIKF